MTRKQQWLAPLLMLAAGVIYSGCGTTHYRNSADKEVYKIINKKETALFSTNSSFSINTRYSARPPKEIKNVEILHERLMAPKRTINLTDALKIAVESNRSYQFRKETLYLTALTLTRARYDFTPMFFASGTATANRTATGDQYGQMQSSVSMQQLANSGAKIVVSVANDILRYYTGDPRAVNSTLMTISLNQPLLRGAGAAIVAENLTQAERDVIYAIRDFRHYQRTFAVDVITAYWRLLQQKDAVRNQYNSYRNLVAARERAEALSRDRLPAYQVDQARQNELSAKSSYILSIQRYQAALDRFKITLGLPSGTDLGLDDSALADLHAIGLIPVSLPDARAFEIAVERRLDLLNEVDKFEDSKRKIVVTANRLKADLNIFANASLASQGATDYTKFNLKDYQAGAGVTLNLPLNRLVERNDYRAALVSFERQIRTLSQVLDDTRNEIRDDLRAIEQARQDYQIQKTATELANQRVEGATLLLQAGRAQIRDLLEAQSAQVAAQNAVTQTLVDFHVARLQLLIDLGILQMERERFWLADQPIPQKAGAPAAAPAIAPMNGEVIPPEKLFGKQ